LHLIVVPQLSGGWQHNYSPVSMTSTHTTVQFG
jgi:hypothetical protein